MPRIQCSVSGLWMSVTTNHKKELVDKFGSEDELNKTYVSRAVRRLRKEGKSDEEIKKMAAAGELESKTSAPRRAGKVAGVKTPKVKKTEEVEVVNEDTEPADADVEGFLAEGK